MDPTQQRRQTPLKAALDVLVLATSTYLLPALGTAVLLVVLEPTGGHIVILCGIGVVFYWGTALEAMTAYRRRIAVPRAIDLSLDPHSPQYLAVLVCRCLVALPLPFFVAVHADGAQAIPFAIGGSVAIWAITGLRESVLTQRDGRPYIQGGSRGPRLKPVRLLRQATRGSPPADKPHILWGGMRLPIRTLLTNCLLLGAIGSGKSLLFKCVLASVLPLVVRNRKWRAMIIDPKCELLPYVCAIAPAYKIRLVNPGDARTFVWDINKDVTNEKNSHQIGHILIQSPRNETQPFFTEAGRALFQGAMESLRLQAPGGWQFHDPFFAVLSIKRMETILKLHSSTRHTFETFANNRRVLFDIHSTLLSKLKQIQPIVNVWSHVQRHHPSRTFSLREWVHGNFILLLGKQASANVSQGRLFEVLLKRGTELLLDQSTGQSTLPLEDARYTLLLIEEMGRAGRLDIVDTLTNGRDYGIGAVCVSQSVDVLLQHYSKEEWAAISNEFNTLAFLSSNAPETLTWMSERLGHTDGRLPPANDKPRSPRAQGDWMPTLDPTQFHTLRHGKKIGPSFVPGVFLNSELGNWHSDEGVDLPAPLDSVPMHVPAPDEWQSIRPWDEQDLERLNLLHLRDELDLDSNDDDSPPAPSSPSPPRTRPPSTQRVTYPRFRPS